jgi:hypothetical protein
MKVSSVLTKEDVLSDLINTVPAVLYKYLKREDQSEQFLYMSPAAETILGHPSEEHMEAYFYKHLEIEFTHGICPSCLKKHHPEDYEIMCEEAQATRTALLDSALP